MTFFVVAVLMIAGFWWWARSDTIKRRGKAPKYGAATRPRARARQTPLDRKQQTYIAIAVIVTQILVLYGNPNILTSSVTGGSGQGTGFGQVDADNLANFPPPDLYQEIGGTASSVTFINASPDALTIDLVKETGERVQLKMPACKECSLYSDETVPACGTIGTPITFQIPPGRYHAVGRFFGTHNTKGFQSDWQLTQGWEHRSCIYTSDEARLL
jgi:hypothetical protein